jgi:hypothetical protein
MKRANNVHLPPTGSFAQEGILWCLQKVLLIQASMKVITCSIFRIQALNQCYSQRLLDQTLCLPEDIWTSHPRLRIFLNDFLEPSCTQFLFILNIEYYFFRLLIRLSFSCQTVLIFMSSAMFLLLSSLVFARMM